MRRLMQEVLSLPGLLVAAGAAACSTGIVPRSMNGALASGAFSWVTAANCLRQW
jgi:hypothetical protein